jgi:hypothetical protein
MYYLVDSENKKNILLCDVLGGKGKSRRARFLGAGIP